MNSIDTIIFDFGDTLTTDTNLSFQKKYGFKKWPKAQQKKYLQAFEESCVGKISTQALFQKVAEACPKKLTERQVAEHMARARAYPTCRLLPALKKHYRVIIFSDNHKGLPERQKKLLRLRALKNIPFVNSAVVGLRKPDPKFYRYLIEHYRLTPKNCVFVDNLKKNLKPAKALGIHTIWYEQNMSKLKGQLKKLDIVF